LLRQRLVEHMTGCSEDAPEVVIGERIGRAFRMDPGAVKRLVDINVAKAGDDPLVEEGILDSSGPIREDGVQVGRRKPG